MLVTCSWHVFQLSLIPILNSVEKKMIDEQIFSITLKIMAAFTSMQTARAERFHCRALSLHMSNAYFIFG